MVVWWITVPYYTQISIIFRPLSYSALYHTLSSIILRPLSYTLVRVAMVITQPPHVLAPILTPIIKKTRYTYRWYAPPSECETPQSVDSCLQRNGVLACSLVTPHCYCSPDVGLLQIRFEGRQGGDMEDEMRRRIGRIDLGYEICPEGNHCVFLVVGSSSSHDRKRS